MVIQSNFTKSLLKHIISLFVVLFLVTTLVAQNMQKVTLQLKWKHQFQFAGYYAAIEKGFYKEVGLDVNLYEAIEGINPSEKVFSGKAEFGVCSSDILLMRGQNKNAVVLATVFQHSPQILLASKKSGIENVHNLVGKRIAIEPNAADIIALMVDEGVTLDKCIVDQHRFNANNLIRGEVDAITAYSADELFNLKEANFEYTQLSPNMGGIDFYGDVLFTTETLIQNEPVLVENFREASLKGWKYAMENREEIIQLIYNKYTKRHSIEHLRFEADGMTNLIMENVVELGYTNPGRWESIANIYKKLNMLKSTFNNNGLLYSDYQKHELTIPWKMIIGFVLIFILIAFIATFFYKSSLNLKNEIKKRIILETDLKESEKKYRFFTEFTADVIWVLNLSIGKFSYISPTVFQLRGFTAEEAMLESLEDSLTPDSVAIVYEAITKNSQKFIAQPELPNHYINEIQQYCKNGEIIWVEVSTQFRYNNIGEIEVVGVSRNIDDRKKVESELKNAQALLKKFATHLQNNQEEERILLATQLDNQIGQILVALKMDIGILKQKVLKVNTHFESQDLLVKLEQVHNIIGNSIKGTLKLMNDLRFEVLYLMGFVEAVKLYLVDFQTKNNISCEFESTILKLNLDQRSETSLFRIFQNAMDNIVLHSKATKVKINLYKKDDKLFLSVWDNGIGFDLQKLSNSDSTGLLFMKERALLLNGELKILSLANQGTRIVVELENITNDT